MKVLFNEKEYEVDEKIKISKLLRNEIKQNEHPVVGAKFNNEYQNLDYEIEKDGKIELIDISQKNGMKIYRRTLVYIMGKAFEELYPNCKIKVNYQLDNAMYCTVDNQEITDEFITKMKAKMEEIINSNLKISKIKFSREEAEKFYEKNDNMLAYMLDNRMEAAQPEEVEQEKYEQVRKRQEERRAEFAEGEGRENRENRENLSNRAKSERSSGEIEKHMKGMRFAAASMFVLLCLVSVVTLQTDGLSKEVSSKIKNLLQGASARTQQSEESLQAMSNDTINTLVAEEQLTEAIRQENQQPNAVVSPLPTEVPTPVATEIPTPLPTEAPTPEPTVEPSPEPTAAPTEAPVQSEKVQNTYMVRSGDTLIGISMSLYGSDAYVDEICELNNISDPDNVQIGQKILLP